MKESNGKVVFAFRWKYVALPLALLLVAVILTFSFYSRLPFPTAWHFDSSSGAPDMWAIPGLFVFWALAVQSALALGAVCITWMMSRLASRFLLAESAVISPQRILLITGNMVGLPQIILVFAMLDIFLYNSYQTHLFVPVWVVGIAVMLIGGVILGGFFVQAMRQVMAANRKVSAKQ